MYRPVIFALLLTSFSWPAAPPVHEAAAAAPAAPKKVPVTTAQAVTRTVPAAFQETGTFIADETSDIAPLVAGRVIATPVNVGDFVKQGQVVCELDHRDAQLRLDQARAALDQATAAVRQSAVAYRLQRPGQVRSPTLVPEAVAARANYESAQAQARQAAADAKRYENLVATGDVSRSRLRKGAHPAGDRRRAGQCRAPAVRGRAQRRAPELGRRGKFPGLARRHAARNSRRPKRLSPIPPSARPSTASSRRARWPPASTSRSPTRSPPSSASAP